MKNNMLRILIICTVVVAAVACKKKYLDIDPNGALDEPTLTSEKGVNRLLISVYAMLDGHDGSQGLGGEWGSSGSNFLYGSIGGAEANKGSDPTDQGPNMTPIQRHDVTNVNGALNDRWRSLYEGVKRSNTVMQVLAKATAIPDEPRANIAGQARFLRAWFHFQARITYGKVPYLDEQIDADLTNGVIGGVANTTDIFPKIVEDAKFAWDNLPETQDAIGRVNKWTAGAFYGKVLLFTGDFATAKTVLQDVVDNGTNSLGVAFDLNTNYDDNFNLDFDNSVESVLAFQSSSQDNAGARNGNWGDLLNIPANGGLGGGGFFTPTYWFVNQFKTTGAGLPVADPQNNQVLDPAGQAGLVAYAGTVDPRLDWTIGRNGVPYHDWGVALTSWQRDPSSGPYLSKKGTIRQAQVEGSHDASVWFAAGGVSLNINLIRFSEVLLMLAEAEVESNGSLTNAFNLVNRVRTRAAGSRTVKTYTNPANPMGGFTNIDAGNYEVAPYPAVFGSTEAARAAIRLERLLELGLEGHRFFDLVRWGIAQSELNAYYAYESPLPYQVLLKPIPNYTSPSDDYYPIPQAQIDLSNGFLEP